MPTAYATMIRCLLDISSLAAGNTILIHSATEPMGLAAIQMARMQRAEVRSYQAKPPFHFCPALTGDQQVFVTAGTRAETDFLVTEQGILPTHVFSSADNTFVEGIMQATQLRGVDVVVNLLTGDLLHESWKCVAEGGNMFELSGKDISGRGKLDMAMFGGNRGFHGINITALVAQKPSLAARYLDTMMSLYTNGSIKPIGPITRFPSGDIKQAFHGFQNNGPIGSVVVEFPDNAQSLPADSYSHDIRFRKDRSYVLVGGLGGLGRSASVWLAERGAGCIIFMSRSDSPMLRSQSLLHELKALGCDTQISTGSVADASVVDMMVANAAKPIAGVLHLALVLKVSCLPYGEQM